MHAEYYLVPHGPEANDREETGVESSEDWLATTETIWGDGYDAMTKKSEVATSFRKGLGQGGAASGAKIWR